MAGRSGESRSMDAAPLLAEIADAFAVAELEAILIGNAGAALRGAHVTTLRFDFVYRVATSNEARLRKVAELLRGLISEPTGGAFGDFGIFRAEGQLEIALRRLWGKSLTYGRLRKRAQRKEVEGREVLVAASGREGRKERGGAKASEREAALEAMRRGSEEELIGMIRRQLALPMHKRTNFLRVRLPDGGSCL